MDLDYFSQLAYPLPARAPTGRGGVLDPAGLSNPLALCPELRAVHEGGSGVALRKLRGPRGPLLPWGAGARGLRPEWTPCRPGDAPAARFGPRSGAEGYAVADGGRRGAHSGGAAEKVGQGAGGGGEREGGGGAVGGGGAGGATPCSRRGGAIGASGASRGWARRALDDFGRGGPREVGGIRQ